MVRFLLFASLAVSLVHAPPARAQEDEDHQLVCPLLTPELVRVILPEIIGHGRCQAACQGCGCKGGPGYRGTDGKCIGYANIIQKCGLPPHRACAAECTPVMKECDHGRVWLKAVLARNGMSVRFVAATDTVLPAADPSGVRPARASAVGTPVPRPMPASPVYKQNPFHRADQPGDGQAKH